MHGFDPAPGFRNLTDQERSVQLLNTVLKKDRIPHALLFSGKEGLGKKSAAVTFSMAANCFSRREESDAEQAEDTPEIPCLTCRSCKKITLDSHPDILRIEPQGAMIKISQIRELLDVLSRKPNEARLRVVHIFDAHKMNSGAGNALLKILEEPPERTIFILTTENSESMLTTIRSRCQSIRFSPIPAKRVEDILIRVHNISKEKASQFSSFSDGSVLKALKLNITTKTHDLIARRNWLIDEIVNLSKVSLFRPLAIAEKLSTDKDKAIEALDLLVTYFRDLIICNTNPELIINRDLKNNLLENKKRFTVSCLISKIDIINNARQRLDSNVGLKLTLEVLILELADV